MSRTIELSQAHEQRQLRVQDEMGRLQNKVALITGAARGHAQTMARRFAAEGALLAICDLIPAEELDATTGAQVREAGSRALCFRTDVSDERQVNEMVERTLAEYGHIDILAPVVGISPARPRTCGTSRWPSGSRCWRSISTRSSCAARRRCRR